MDPPVVRKSRKLPRVWRGKAGEGGIEIENTHATDVEPPPPKTLNRRIESGCLCEHAP